MKSNKLIVLGLAVSAIFSSCSSDEDDEVIPKGDYENGILISHEGNFGQGNASISFISDDFLTVENNVFSNVNASPLGDTAQSITFNDDLAYIVLNVSNKIEVVNRYTFESVATINTDVINPRHMAISNGKGYISAWGDFSDTEDDALLVVDLATNTISETISTSYLPEKVISTGDKVFVATGIFGYGNKVDVINTNTDELEESVTVGSSPNSFQLDSNNDLWVLSSENLIEIDSNTNEILRTLEFDESITSPTNLNIENNNFYFYAGGSVYKQDEGETSITASAVLSDLNFYSMVVKNGILYGLDAKDFT
ncbi:YncE family protein, partial [Algibacter sp.]|nr:YncE family protein [Algibacter sp.]